MDGQQRWISVPAVRWALDEAADVPKHLVAALVAVASFTDEQGCGAWPSVSTVAAMIRKRERATQNDLDELRTLGLLLLGDQELAKDIRADRRPVVYDLPMPRGAVDCTPLTGHGVQSTTERGAVHGRHGVQWAAPEQERKKKEQRARAPASGRRAVRCDPNTPGNLSEACRRGYGDGNCLDWCACPCHP